MDAEGPVGPATGLVGRADGRPEQQPRQRNARVDAQGAGDPLHVLVDGVDPARRRSGRRR